MALDQVTTAEALEHLRPRIADAAQRLGRGSAPAWNVRDVSCVRRLIATLLELQTELEIVREQRGLDAALAQEARRR